jgi:hypothetical protein
MHARESAEPLTPENDLLVYAAEVGSGASSFDGKQLKAKKCDHSDEAPMEEAVDMCIQAKRANRDRKPSDSTDDAIT